MCMCVCVRVCVCVHSPLLGQFLLIHTFIFFLSAPISFFSFSN